MAIYHLSPESFSEVPVSTQSIAQAKSGIVLISDVPTPQNGDWIVLSPGDTVGVSGQFYASGSGFISLVAV